MSQTTLYGDRLDAETAEEWYRGDPPKCARIDGGERCGYYAVVAVDLDGTGYAPVCRVHAKQSWLDAAGID